MERDLPPEYLHALGKVVTGGVRTDATTRILYSTDASIYQVEPLGVAFPRDEDELAAAVETSHQFGIPVLPRGSGSSIAGQAIGPAMILDCSRYLDRIVEIDPERREAVVQPGVIVNALNRAAARHGLQFGPDPASSERATIGGALANNATGAHSIWYGMAADHLLEVEACLSDGSLATFRSMPVEAAQRIATGSADNLEGAIYRAALSVRETTTETIRDAWPRTWRRASGYGLNYLLPYSPSEPPMWARWQGSSNGQGVLPYPPVANGEINLAPVLAGSEGTLAVIRRARLRLVDLPPVTVLGVLPFGSLVEACDATPGLLEHAPTAVELIPDTLIRLAQSVPAYAAQLGFINHLLVDGDLPAALLVVEFSGSNIEELRQKARMLAPGVFVADRLETQRQVWGVRKVAMGLLNSRPGDLKSTAFVEDLSVPVERLGEFVREMERILAEFNTTGEFAAHASAGCLHIRPMLDLKTSQGVSDLRAFAREAVRLTLRLGGSVSGEHGDGRARSEWLREMYGDELMQAFRAVKKAADPMGLLNPGNKPDAPAMDTGLRIERMKSRDGWQTVMDFSKQTGVLGAIELCNGAGVCRKMEGVMCPSFQATREEMHSTRGRANLLRAMIYSGMTSDRYPVISEAAHQALDLCLACKGCKAECPSGVDVARLKYEFNHLYYKSHRRPLRDYIFGYIGQLTAVGSPLGTAANRVFAQPVFRNWLEKAAGIDRRRALPTYAPRSFRKLVEPVLTAANPNLQERVLFLSDPFTDYYLPGSGVAAIRVLLKSGVYPVILPISGAGRTMISKGMLPEARQHARKVVEAIYRADPDGTLPVVGVEPSEIYTLVDEYLDLLPGDVRVESIAARSWMIDEYLIRPNGKGESRVGWLKERDQRSPECVYLHGHCYQKVRPPQADGYPAGVGASVALLKTAGYEVCVIDSGCCGMAGAFGYEREHYDLSMQIGNLALFPAIREAVGVHGSETLVAACGISCQGQIKDGTGTEALHPIMLVHRKVGE